MNQSILLEKGKTVVSKINIGSLSEALRGYICSVYDNSTVARLR